MKNKNSAYLIWAALTIFYLHQYIYRVSMGIMEVEIRTFFNITAESFSGLAALFLYGYSLCQIPFGIIVDRIGTKRTIIASAIIYITGLIIFALSTNILYAYIARLLTGIGAAPIFICAMKATSDFLPKGQRGFLAGATLAIGQLSTLFVAKPISTIAIKFNWQDIVYILIVCSVIPLLACILMPNPHKKREAHHESSNVLAKLRYGLTHKSIISISIIAAGLFIPFMVCGDTWGPAFLATKFNLPREVAAQDAMLIYVGGVIGSFTFPYFFERRNIVNFGIQISCLCLTFLLSFLFLSSKMDYNAIKLVIILIGIFGAGGELLCFTAVVQYTTIRNSGTILGIVNTANMLGGAIMQQIIGWILDRLWHGGLDAQGIHIYNAAEFSQAFMSLVAIIALCTILSFLALKKEPSI